MAIKRFFFVPLLLLLTEGSIVFGQCTPRSLPYTSDLRTGFHTPHVGVSSMTGWSQGANWDNCWLGYLWKADDEPVMASGNFGVGGEWPTWHYYCRIAVPDSLHRAVAMLVAPEVEEGLASVSLTLQLFKECYVNQPVCTNYCAYIDYGWVRDVGQPMETFDMQGTLCIYTRNGNGVSDHNLSADWPQFSFPVADSLPAGSRFALRMRSELQGPHPFGIYWGSWRYAFSIKEFTASNTPCNPALTSDTVYLSDSVCQHTPYGGYGVALSAGQTADTGLQTFTMRNFECQDDGSFHEHVKLLTLRVLPTDVTHVYDSILPGDAYNFAGRNIISAGEYNIVSGQNVFGCPVIDSLHLEIKKLPPMECNASIVLDRQDWYILSPVDVHISSENEATVYRWEPEALFADNSLRDVSFQLSPGERHRIRLTVDYLDSINFIYGGNAIDTMTNRLWLKFYVEPNTHYRLEMTIGDSTPAPIRVYTQSTKAFDGEVSGLLTVDFYSDSLKEYNINIYEVSLQNVRMSGVSVRRYCRAEDAVTIVSQCISPRIIASKDKVCVGDALILEAQDVENVIWGSSPYDSTLDVMQGLYRIEVSPIETTVYYLLSPGGDVIDSHYVEVGEYPNNRIVADRDSLDFNHPLVELKQCVDDISTTHWEFSDGYIGQGRSMRHIYNEVNTDGVWCKVMGCTHIGCCSDTLLFFPVSITAAWFPNAFTPEADGNNRFGMVASNTVDEYKLYIYNRNGLLVYKTDNINTTWDGTDINGRACPQGSYAYICIYRFVGGYTKQYKGTVLLLR